MYNPLLYDVFFFMDCYGKRRELLKPIIARIDLFENLTRKSISNINTTCSELPNNLCSYSENESEILPNSRLDVNHIFGVYNGYNCYGFLKGAFKLEKLVDNLKNSSYKFTNEQ